MQIQGYAATKAESELTEHEYQDDVGPNDVAIEITHCGICHSDIHLIDDDWGMSEYPFIPGHEIVGTVKKTGKHVTHLQEGERVGVGWQCASCHSCEYCLDGEHENCPQQQPTCVGRNGGFANGIVVDSKFAIKIPEELESAKTAPMLCGGITVYKPLSEHADSESRVAVIGIGGLGHFALQFAHAMGCEVTAITTSPDKADQARSLGADHVLDANDQDALQDAQGSFDVIINTAPAALDWQAYLAALRPRGVFVQAGAAPANIEVPPMSIIAADKQVVGSHIGSPQKIAEMLRFAAQHDIGAVIEEYAMQDINDALDKSRQGAQYRVVLKR